MQFFWFNGKEYNNCSLEFTRVQLKAVIIATNIERVKIIGFNVKVPRKATQVFKGNQSNPMSQYVYRLPYLGDTISIFNIKTNKGKLDSDIRVKLVK